jgi:protein O-mannosyl-transferase
VLIRRHHLLLIAVVVLAAYSPALLAGFSRYDDAALADSYRAAQGCDLRRLFVPFSEGFYYRPLIGVSFFLDKYILGLKPSLMHLENILIHLVNAILVYFLTRQIIALEKKSESDHPPLLAALLFGLHPINTESVNWISGRTDLLAGMFILMSALCLLKFLELHEKKYVLLFFVVFTCGALVKETALAFLPGAFFMASAGHVFSEDRSGLNTAIRARSHSSVLATAILPGILVVLLFLSLRFIAFRTNASRIGLTIMTFSDDWIHSLFVMLRAFGFYMKKLIFPFPLNIAIMEVDPLYEVLAVLLVALCMYIATRRSLSSAVFLSGIFFIIPAFLIAFGQIAWTPYAERYLYITSAFFIIAAVAYLDIKLVPARNIYTAAAVMIILAIFFSSTLLRSITWKSDLTLYEDAVEKSPQSRELRAGYGELLIQKGDYAAALVQLEQGKSISSLDYDERFDLNMSYIYYKLGKIDEAITLSKAALIQSRNKSVKALDSLIVLLKEKMKSAGRPAEENALKKEILLYARKLFDLNHDPRLLFDISVLAAELGEKNDVIQIYRPHAVP